MASNDDNFAAHLAIYEKFRNDPAFEIYWKNWKKCQNWFNQCEKAYHEAEEEQKRAAWDKAQEDIDSLLKSMEDETGSGSQEPAVENIDDDQDIVMDNTEEMSEFYRITMEHRKQREAERERFKEEEAKKPQVEYIDATDIGIHGITSHTVNKKMFGEVAKDHLADMQAKYGAHAEKIMTLESTLNYKFDELVSKYSASLWPNIPFRL